MKEESFLSEINTISFSGFVSSSSDSSSGSVSSLLSGIEETVIDLGGV